MFVRELIFALLLAGLLSGIYALLTRRRGKRTGFLWLLLIVFLVTWAGGIWFGRLGPSLHGVHWLPFVLVGIIFALLLMVVTSSSTPRGRHQTIARLKQVNTARQMQKATYFSLSLLFWVVLVMLVVAIVIRYLFYS